MKYTCFDIALLSTGTFAFTVPTPAASSLAQKQCQCPSHLSPLFSSHKPTSSPRSALSATKQLTPRQMQFWEDVDEGLVGIEKFYEKQGHSMERIKTFCKRARGDLPLPEPAAVGHQPSEEHVDGLTANAFWDVAADSSNFPWAAELESNAGVIIEEFEQKLLQANTDNLSLFSGDSAWQSKVMGTGWSAFRLQRLGVWNVKNCAAVFSLHRCLSYSSQMKDVLNLLCLEQLFADNSL
jgi:hypothetical protein